MHLYSNSASPACRNVIVVANLLGISLEVVQIDARAGDHKTPDYLLMNPNGMFPVLRDGDFALWESNAITQYLAALQQQTTLWPNDARLRADIARWQFWGLAHWFPALRPFMIENFFKQMRGGGVPDLEIIANGTPVFARLAAILDHHLSSRQWMSGANLTLADICLASPLMYREKARLPMQAYVHLNRWFEAIAELPAWKAAE